MESSLVCRHFKFGHCRYLDTCRYEHVKEVCGSTECAEESCRKRHPRPCFYYSVYKHCKFGSFCHYSHEDHQSLGQFQVEKDSFSSEFAKLVVDFETLKQENEDLKKKVEEMELKLIELDIAAEKYEDMVLQISREVVTSKASGLYDHGNLNSSARLYETPKENAVRHGRGLRPSQLAKEQSFPPWSYKTP